MLLTLDQTTVANMTAVVEHVCRQIRPEKDSHVVRKAIADAMSAGANSGTRSLPQLREIGFAELKKIVQPKNVAGDGTRWRARWL
jgi:predicted ATP-dependent serine protease